MKGIYQLAANLLWYIPTKYYWNRSTSDLVIAKSKRVNFFWNTVYFKNNYIMLHGSLTENNRFALMHLNLTAIASHIYLLKNKIKQ